MADQTASETGLGAGGRLSRFTRRMVDWFYPPQCLSCGSPVERAPSLCANCWPRLRRITAPMCPVLGLPFEYDLGPGALSAEAIAEPPDFDWARAAVIYNEVAQQLVSRLKYADHHELAPFMAGLMADAVRDKVRSDTLLVPVPLHRRRQWRRRFNQSALLARWLARHFSAQMETGLVFRKRATRQQVGLSANQRAENVRGAFMVDPQKAVQLAGRQVILVDDVLTTGSTVSAISRVLGKAGIGETGVLTFARVVIGDENDIY